jgi:hypothetical protein
VDITRTSLFPTGSIVVCPCSYQNFENSLSKETDDKYMQIDLINLNLFVHLGPDGKIILKIFIGMESECMDRIRLTIRVFWRGIFGTAEPISASDEGFCSMMLY